MDFIQRPMGSTVGDVPQSRMAQAFSGVNGGVDGDDEDLLRCIVKAADDRKASDITVLRVDHLTTLTSYLVILSGTSRPQNRAIAASVMDSVQENFVVPVHRSNNPNSQDSDGTQNEELENPTAGLLPAGGVPEGSAERPLAVAGCHCRGI